MSSIQARFSDRARLFTDGGNTWDTILREAAQETANRLQREMLEELDKKLDSQPTGTTRRGVATEIKKDGEAYTVEVGWLTGSRGVPIPHYIRQLNYGGPIPKQGEMPPGKFLVFQWKGETIFAKKVHQKGRHFIEPVRRRTKRIASQEFNSSVQRNVDKLRGGTASG